MRVLMVTLDNHIGGIAIRAMNVAERLRGQNIETIFALPNEAGMFAAEAEKRGFLVYKLMLKRPSMRRVARNVIWFLSFPVSVFAFVQIIRRERIDILHVNGLMNLQAPVAAILMNRPIVWHLANTVYPKWLVKLLMPLLSRIAYPITISALVDNYYCGASQYRRRIIHDPVDVYGYKPNSTIAEKHLIKQSLGISEDTLIVGTVGNIIPIKGYEYLVKSIHLVAERHSNVHFLAVGAIFDSQLDFKTKLDRIIKESNSGYLISFLGQRFDIMSLLSIFDLFVLPSLAEGTPIAILEAMAMEVPVIATNVGGIPDLVEHDVTGVLIPPRKINELSQAIIELLSDPERRKEMGCAGRMRVQESFSLEQCVVAHLEVYSAVMN